MRVSPHKLRQTSAAILSSVLDPILRFVEYAIIALACGMMGVAFVQVILRYGLNASFFGSEELARYLFTWFIFFSAALGLDRGIHFAVDVIVDLLPTALQRGLQILVQLIILAIASLLVVKGADLTIRNWVQISSAMEVPLSFPYAAIPVAGAIMVLISLRKLIRPVEGPDGAERD